MGGSKRDFTEIQAREYAGAGSLEGRLAYLERRVLCLDVDVLALKERASEAERNLLAHQLEASIRLERLKARVTELERKVTA